MTRWLVSLLTFASLVLGADGLDPKLWQELKWRMIGPFRAGRTVGAVGVPSHPNTFFIGVNHGGVWKTTDAGRTWKPIFDQAPTGSVGDIAVFENDPNIIYVGSGEGLQRPDLSVGDGIYKTTDGGKTWRNMGLRDAQQIGRVIVDYKDPKRVFVAAMGHPYGPNEERGIYRTLDGGETWKRVLYIDADTGATQIEFDSKDANILYATMWAGRQGPWENGAWQGPGSGLYKSTDGGETWKPLTKGLPTFAQGLGRIGFDVAPRQPNVIYAVVDANAQFGGIYRSEDAGESWKQVSRDGRTWGRGSDFAEIRVHPKDHETVFVANTASYVSRDGGKTFTAFKGAPGGDDYHRIWIDWDKPEVMLFATDQGASITVNGGESWSSWYNQPTAQFYHVTTDNRFPYWVYGGQQESGSAGVASRSDYGAITARDWQSVGIDEYGYVAVDPLNSDILYGGKMNRFDRRTGQSQSIAPDAVRSGRYRFLRTAPAVFSMVDKKTLFYAGNVLFKTLDGGQNWQVISPDLSREKTEVPASIGVYRNAEMEKMARRGVIYTVAPSFQDLLTIWAGTDDGLIHLTRDGGKTWKNVTPPELTSWSKVSLMEASHFNAQGAYAAVNRIRCSDMRPYIYKTADGGKTWKLITQGIPDNEPINAVREDPAKKGLLYAGSENAVYVSFDDGEHWQSLRLDMPATSIRDLVIKDDDLVVGTHGRGFWILDDINPLRQLSESLAVAPAILYKPAKAYRVRWNMYTDTPVPQEEPAGENPPDGVAIHYYLQQSAKEEVLLEIADASGKIVRRISNNDKEYKLPADLNIPTYWIRPQQSLSTEKGAHTFVWNLRYAPLETSPAFPIAAVYQNTAPETASPWVLPGNYTITLIANGQSYSQPLTIKMDPRVKLSQAQLEELHSVSLTAYQARQTAQTALQEIAIAKKQLKEYQPNGKTDPELIARLMQETSELEGVGGRRMRAPANKEPGFATIESQLASIGSIWQEADRSPTSQSQDALKQSLDALNKLQTKWDALKQKIANIQ
ncbi:MAG: glycoside hydrolase [Bacteroidetes bacterium]|nr:glycoside hydrolase [Bacteroidota bacterium]